jgi:hypothetical protein
MPLTEAEEGPSDLVYGKPDKSGNYRGLYMPDSSDLVYGKPDKSGNYRGLYMPDSSDLVYWKA